MKTESISELLADLTPTQNVCLAILAAKEVCKEQGFLDWANKWLEGKDRTSKSAMAVIWNLPTSTVVATFDHPAPLTRPKLRANVKAVASFAAEAAAKVVMPGMKTEDLVRQALQSAIAENKAIDLNALAELARETC